MEGMNLAVEVVAVEVVVVSVRLGRSSRVEIGGGPSTVPPLPLGRGCLLTGLRCRVRGVVALYVVSGANLASAQHPCHCRIPPFHDVLTLLIPDQIPQSETVLAWLIVVLGSF